MPYSNETKLKIADFIVKAKNKIASLGTQLADNQTGCLELLLNLSDFLENLTSCYYNESETEVLQTIDYFAAVGNFVDVPMLQIPDFDTYIEQTLQIVGGGGVPTLHTHTIAQILGLEEELLARPTEDRVQEMIDEALEGFEAVETLGEDLRVTGVTVGNVSDGTILESEMDWRAIFKEILSKEIAPSYAYPQASLSKGGYPDVVEVGTNITPSIIGNITQQDAGPILTYRLSRNSTQIHQGLPITAFAEARIIAEEIVRYSAVFTYDEGPIKNTNIGNPFPAGRIPAGSVTTNEVSVRGARKAFYGVNGNSTTSDGIRGLAGSVLSPSAGTSFTINIPVGAESVIFAYPGNLPVVKQVIYVEGLGAPVQEVFTLTQVMVEGYNKYAEAPYKVYVYVPAQPFSQKATYVVTI